jgi:hypothetical protein
VIDEEPAPTTHPTTHNDAVDELVSAKLDDTILKPVASDIPAPVETVRDAPLGGFELPAIDPEIASHEEETTAESKEYVIDVEPPAAENDDDGFVTDPAVAATNKSSELPEAPLDKGSGADNVIDIYELGAVDYEPENVLHNA